MDCTIKEDNILEVKALTMSRGIFAQVADWHQDEAKIHFATKADCHDTKTWLGYVIDGKMQFASYLILVDGTLKKIRDVDLFFIMRTSEHPNAERDLQKKLNQIFLR